VSAAPSNPALKEIDDPEFTMTKGEWEDLQLRFGVTLDGELTASLTPEQEAEIANENAEAVRTALSTLILRHPVEFHELLAFERAKRNITMQVSSEFADYLAIAEKNSK